MEPLRECKCGCVAMCEEDLHLFAINKNSKHQRRNQCKICHALETAGGYTKPKVPYKSCAKCKVKVSGLLAIEKAFRRTTPTGDQVIGNLASVCKKCEFDNAGFIEIDGRFIPVGAKGKGDE